MDECGALRPPKPQRKPRAPKVSSGENAAPREGLREKARVNYAEVEHIPGLPRAVRPRILRTLDEEEVEALREKNGKQAQEGGDEDMTASQAERKASRGPIDSGKGIRIQASPLSMLGIALTVPSCPACLCGVRPQFPIYLMLPVASARPEPTLRMILVCGRRGARCTTQRLVSPVTGE